METISRISLNEDSHYIQWYIPILQQQFLQFSWIRINLFVPNAPFLYARGYEECFVLFLFFFVEKTVYNKKRSRNVTWWRWERLFTQDKPRK